MTNIGLLALKFCECLIVLSIVRSERNYPSFKRVKNIGMFHVSERCRRLESVKLGGFAKVTEAGYSSILHSCRNLKKFEVLTSPLLSDSVFDNMIGVASICTAASVTSSQNPIDKSVNALAADVMVLRHSLGVQLLSRHSRICRIDLAVRFRRLMSDSIIQKCCRTGPCIPYSVSIPHFIMITNVVHDNQIENGFRAFMVRDARHG
ncbi:F-box protein At-B [Capsicum baccatum]|uniref:F-box protein At-B n=1 Tax=Capsicum baccatum TaxID=33114 RepID=A0A2G2WFW6_CAPBA|nr:F-box protein At-B [Capsicum baccatum]